MNENIRTAEAKLDLVKKFLDYAHVANASYAMLHYIYKNNKNESEAKADGLTFGATLEQDINVIDPTCKDKLKCESKDSQDHIITKHKGTNTAYACAIESRFMKYKSVDRKGIMCTYPGTFFHKHETLYDPIHISINHALSEDTIAFTNRYRVLEHQPNTNHGFSATLFGDTQLNQRIFAIRGAEISDWHRDIMDADIKLALNTLPINQYIDMIQFYCQCVSKGHITDQSLIIVGHSLGGVLAQLLALSLATSCPSANTEKANTGYGNVKEVYIFNSPGARDLEIEVLGKAYEIDSVILKAKDVEKALFEKIRGHEYNPSDHNDRSLFGEIRKYLSDSENLKEHSIFLKSNIIKNPSAGLYKYEILCVDMTFVNCITTLRKNNEFKKPLTCHHSIHHIKTNDDSDSNNIKLKEIMQSLGQDIAGKHYVINLGQQFWRSHFLIATIIELKTIITRMQGENIDNLLEYNKIKENESKRLKISINSYEQIKLPPYFSYYPTPLHVLQETMAYKTHSFSQEPKKRNYTDGREQGNKRSDNIKTSHLYQNGFKTHSVNLAIYNNDIRSYFRFYKTYQDSLHQEYLISNALLANQILLHLPKEETKQIHANLYDTLNLLYSKKLYYSVVESNDIENLSVNDIYDSSKLAYFYCLYACNPLIVLDSHNKPTLNENIAIDNFGYKDDFTNMFVLNKDSLSSECLEARKSLYRSFMKLEAEKQSKCKKEQERINNLNYEEYQAELRRREQEQRQAGFNGKDKYRVSNKLILESNDKSIRIIFLDKISINQAGSPLNNNSLLSLDSSKQFISSTQFFNNISLSNLLHIHDDKIDIFTKNGSEIDIESLINNYELDFNLLHSSNTQIFLYSSFLAGGTESFKPSNECFFGELDSNDSNLELSANKPIYRLRGNKKSINSAHGNITGNSTLQIFFNNSTLTIRHYSVVHSSLHIKLECKSAESKAIVDQEEKIKQEFKSKDFNNPQAPCTSRTLLHSSVSGAFLHPLLEDNELKCPHNGVVKLKSNKGKPFQSKGIPMILESDLLYSSIIGCTNNIAGVPTPCTQVATILPSARGLKKYNDDYPIMQDLCVSGVLSDKGFPLICTPKPNTFRINASSPANGNAQSKEAIESQIPYIKPTFTICYKIDHLQKNSLDIYTCQINTEDITQDTPLQSYVLHLAECENVDSTTLPQTIQAEYPAKYYTYKCFFVVFDNHTREYIALIPKKIPKILEKAYSKNEQAIEFKDYGYGGFRLLDNTEKLYKEHKIYSREIWLYPAKAEKLLIAFGSEEKEHIQDEHNIHYALSNIHVR